MFGRDWEPVVGTVIDKQYRGSRRYGSGPERAVSIQPGARVALLCHGKHRSLKWDDNDALLKVARGIGVTAAERRASGFLDDEFETANSSCSVRSRASSSAVVSVNGAVWAFRETIRSVRVM
jgi:hypothetical protein